MERSDDTTLEEAPSLGKLLLWTRSRRELSQQDVAEALNLSEEIINAIENDESIEGISQTYERGYQRAYVRFLELDESEVLGKAHSSPQYSDNHENLQIVYKNMSMRGSRSGINFPFMLLMPLLFIGLVIIYWPQISSVFSSEDTEQVSQAATVRTETGTQVIQTLEIKPNASANTSVSPVKGAEVSAVNEQQVASPQDVTEDTQLTIEQILDPTAAAQSTSSENNQDTVDEGQEQAESQAASAAAQQSHSTITFIADGESWLDIRDAENTRLFRNILKLDQVTVTGVLPLKIRTGNLTVLRIQVSQGKQRKVDVFDDSTTVADFTVDKDEAGRLQFSAQ